MAEDIPSECDLVVVGTGLVESIVAAAASRVGKQVIHIDHRDFYGSNWASFSYSNLPSTLEPSQLSCDDKKEKLNKEHHISINLNQSSILNIIENWEIPDESPPDAEDVKEDESTADESTEPKVSVPENTWSKESVLKNSRKFNFDLAPKVLYSRGDMVDVLISSGICRYAEFKNVSGIYTYDITENNLLAVPCSRADIFNTKDIGMVEKRLLMKIMTLCVDYETKPENFKDFESKSFGDFLSFHNIHGKIRQYLIESVAMASESTSFCDAMKSIQKFVHSIGRYGNTPFLWTLYGSGELPQCFCRCSAVFGGIYCLNRSIQYIEIGSDGQAVGIVSDGQKIKTKFVMMEDSLNPSAIVKSGISRAILVTDRALTNHQAALISFPSVDGREPVRILELSAATMACPRDLYVVHLITPQVSTAVEDLKEVIQTLFHGCSKSDVPKPNILWSLHFNMKEYQSSSNGSPSNVYYGSGPNSSIDIDDYVTQAKTIFHSMFPDEEFLPRVPDPEDIILEGSFDGTEQQESTATSEQQESIPTLDNQESTSI